MIHVEGLTKYYDNFCAVDHIDLDIQGGEIVGLLGPNGAGKTTTLRMLTGYFQPTSGDIQVKTQSIYDDPLAIKRLIGYLPESAPLYKSMIVYDYLEHIARIRDLAGEAKEQRIAELVEMCALNGIMHKTIDTLSKGLKQRVGLAHAMMSDPEILILDEPTSGLDPNQIVEIREIIRKIGREKTVILSTHILSEAEATCDRIVIINKGRIIADGNTQELTVGKGGDRHIQIGLMGVTADEAVPLLKEVPGVSDVVAMACDEANTIRLDIICRSEGDVRPDLYAAVKATDWVMVELSRESKNLETIFRELTREN